MKNLVLIELVGLSRFFTESTWFFPSILSSIEVSQVRIDMFADPYFTIIGIDNLYMNNLK
jgi:hypothetical protein